MMKAGQFWILTASSALVSLLLVYAAWLERDLDHRQRALVDRQEFLTKNADYEDAWKQLVIKAYQVGNQDPAILELIHGAGVNIQTGTPPPEPPAPVHPGT